MKNSQEKPLGAALIQRLCLNGVNFVPCTRIRRYKNLNFIDFYLGSKNIAGDPQLSAFRLHGRYAILASSGELYEFVHIIAYN